MAVLTRTASRTVRHNGLFDFFCFLHWETIKVLRETIRVLQLESPGNLLGSVLKYAALNTDE